MMPAQECRINMLIAGLLGALAMLGLTLLYRTPECGPIAQETTATMLASYEGEANE